MECPAQFANTLNGCIEVLLNCKHSAGEKVVINYCSGSNKLIQLTQKSL